MGTSGKLPRAEHRSIVKFGRIRHQLASRTPAGSPRRRRAPIRVRGSLRRSEIGRIPAANAGRAPKSHHSTSFNDKNWPLVFRNHPFFGRHSVAGGPTRTLALRRRRQVHPLFGADVKIARVAAESIRVRGDGLVKISFHHFNG